MSGPNPPEPGPGSADPGDGQDAPEDREPSGSADAEHAEAGPTGETVSYEAYSAPESEQFVSGPYVPVDPRLYDYDTYDSFDESGAEPRPPRWPWVVGVAVIVAAIALVVSVGLLAGNWRTEPVDLATPATTTLSVPPVQDEITTTVPPPPPPTTPPPPPVVETPEPTPPPEPPEPTHEAVEPAPETTSEAPVTTTTTTAAPARPRQIVYSVTGTKALLDQITITYIDAAGQRQTLRNAVIPWSLTLTPISLSEVGSVEASSMLRLSKLNCSITSSDGTVLSANNNDAPQASC